MSPDERPLSALPSPKARALAFATILVAGVCGALIGWSLVTVQCEPAGDCTATAGVGAVIGGLVAAIGVAVVAVLTLRAMGEWKTIKGRESVGEPE